MKGAIDPGCDQSRDRSWYFSESRYSSLPSRTDVLSQSSYPLYIPHEGHVIAASTARILKAAGPPCWRVACRMSGVFTQKFGRNQSTNSVCDSSVKYWPSSQALLRQVKYVYDWEKPILAIRCITAGRTKASASMTTSGCSRRISAISHSQNGNALVCGLSTRKM